MPSVAVDPCIDESALIGRGDPHHLQPGAAFRLDHYRAVETSDESSEVRFFAPAEIDTLDMHESIRLRIRHYLEQRPQAVIA
jgi:hypothetical protein